MAGLHARSDIQDKQSSSLMVQSKASQENSAQDSSGAFSSLAIRVVSGALYAILFIAALVLGRYTTALWVACMSVLCCYEFYRMMRRDGKLPNEYLGLVAAALFPLSVLGRSELQIGVLVVLMLAVGLWYVYTPRTRAADVAITFFGSVYTGFMLSAIVLTRAALPGSGGALLSVGVCASLWVSDSCAYLVGSRFGAHKMAPKISPHKSWEGFAAGIAGSLLIWLILWASGFYGLNLFYTIFVAFAVSVMGVFGDLIESRIKRGAGVKDSGNLIPGHGGMLDRSDSLMFGCFTAHLLLSLGGVL